MKIIDCTTYYSEDLMLDIRFNILNEFVDKFIIVESKFSHSGKPKPLNFDINKFQKFKDKIEYLIIENEPEGIVKNIENSSEIKRKNSLLRIEQSYNFIMNALNDVNENDLVCLSDNDEIPNFNSKYFKNSNKDIFIFKQLFFYYKLNLLYDLIPWYGSKAAKKKNLVSMSWLRNLKNKKYPFWRIDTLFSMIKYQNIFLIKNGGWHFSYMKTAKNIEKKLTSYLHHREYDLEPLGENKIQNMINSRKPVYDLRVDMKKSKFEGGDELVVSGIDELPNYIKNNLDKYKDWLD